MLINARYYNEKAYSSCNPWYAMLNHMEKSFGMCH